VPVGFWQQIRADISDFIARPLEHAGEQLRALTPPIAGQIPEAAPLVGLMPTPAPAAAPLAAPVAAPATAAPSPATDAAAALQIGVRSRVLRTPPMAISSPHSTSTPRRSRTTRPDCSGTPPSPPLTNPRSRHRQPPPPTGARATVSCRGSWVSAQSAASSPLWVGRRHAVTPSTTTPRTVFTSGGITSETPGSITPALVPSRSSRRAARACAAGSSAVSLCWARCQSSLAASKPRTTPHRSDLGPVEQRGRSAPASPRRHQRLRGLGDRRN
jgi:hypothetical protein